MNRLLDASLLGGFARAHAEYAAAVFDGGKVTEHIACGDKLALGSIAPHASLLVKIMPQDAFPAVVGSNGHYSMGAEFKRLEIVGGELLIELSYGFDYPVSYTIRLPEGLRAASRDVPVTLSARGDYSIRVPLTKE